MAAMPQPKKDRVKPHQIISHH